MSDSFIPLDRHEVKESGRAIQQAQNTVMAAGSAATIALIRELLKSLKLPEKSVSVKIAIDDSVAYQANVRDGKSVGVESETSNFSEQQLRYLKEVVKLPESNEPTAASIPLDKNGLSRLYGVKCSSMLHYRRGLALPNPYQVCIIRFTYHHRYGRAEISSSRAPVRTR